MKIYLAFDLDYESDYDYLQNIFLAIGDTPATYFVSGSRHPVQPAAFLGSSQIGNHSFLHEEWYGKSLQDRIRDMEKNHEFIKTKYKVEPTVYRSPHLRNFPDTQQEMVLRGYKPEMECAVCPYCQPFEHSHLKRYFSSHHFFSGTEADCKHGFVKVFEDICKKGDDFTFFLDPHHFGEERSPLLKELIETGKKYGSFELL